MKLFTSRREFHFTSFFLMFRMLIELTDSNMHYLLLVLCNMLQKMPKFPIIVHVCLLIYHCCVLTCFTLFYSGLLQVSGNVPEVLNALEIIGCKLRYALIPSEFVSWMHFSLFKLAFYQHNAGKILPERSFQLNQCTTMAWPFQTYHLVCHHICHLMCHHI